MAELLTTRKTTFEGFGPSILSAVAREKLAGSAIPKDRMQARAMLHDHCPITPGVYGWLDNNNQICYVGKSKCLRKRLLSYFAKNPPDKKTIRIVQHSHRLVWEPVSHELLALIREQELIYRWRPEFNTQGQPVKRQPAFLCISGGGCSKRLLYAARDTEIRIFDWANFRNGKTSSCCRKHESGFSPTRLPRQDAVFLRRTIATVRQSKFGQVHSL